MLIITPDIYLDKFNKVRQWTTKLCEPLQTEDFVVQPIVDVSPPKWHMGHTTWFFEQFVLKKYLKGYKEFNPGFNYIFNSYYESVGKRVMRADRGNLTRPSVTEIKEYRKYVDEKMNDLLSSETPVIDQLPALLELGLNHEQQHQELLLTDLKYILGHNPLLPVYVNNKKSTDVEFKKLSFLEVEEDVYEIGYKDNHFHFDNEKGVHKIFLHRYKIADRLITNGEYLEFMNNGGYKDFVYWLQEGFEWVKANNISSPLYWHFIEGEWYNFTLHGLQKVNMNDPVTHVSYYEADAFARWHGMRLPTEFEWEIAAKIFSPVVNEEANFLETEFFQPAGNIKNHQLFGDAWEWTQSAYLPYPYYKKPEGAVGEYNGKFMINQMVLRGGSCATPANHIRHTYRNFFHPDKQWQFTGIRLAQHI